MTIHIKYQAPFFFSSAVYYFSAKFLKFEHFTPYFFGLNFAFYEVIS